MLFLNVFVPVSFSFRGLSAPDAEMLYMQEVEKMEGYGQESYQAKVSLWGPEEAWGWLTRIWTHKLRIIATAAQLEQNSIG